MKIKFNSDDNLPLNKIIELPIMAIAVRTVFLESNKYYPQIFLGESLYKILTKSKNELKKIDIKNCVCYYFNDIMI